MVLTRLTAPPSSTPPSLSKPESHSAEAAYTGVLANVACTTIAMGAKPDRGPALPPLIVCYIVSLIKVPGPVAVSPFSALREALLQTSPAARCSCRG